MDFDVLLKNMLHEERKPGQFHFVEFDADDIKYLKGREINRIRIDGTRLTELPHLELSGSKHIFIQGSRSFNNLGDNSPFSTVIDSCHQFKKLESHQINALRVLEIRNCKRLIDYSVLNSAPDLRSLAVTVLPRDATGFDAAFSVGLEAAFLAPMTAKRMLEFSCAFPDIVFCNGPNAFVDGVRQADNSVCYDRADEVENLDGAQD